MNAKRYIGKKIKIGEETVKIKKLLKVDDTNHVPNPSFWVWKFYFETCDGKIVLLKYAPYGVIDWRKKVWVFLDLDNEEK
jgi:hypothetical protein